MEAPGRLGGLEAWRLQGLQPRGLGCLGSTAFGLGGLKRGGSEAERERGRERQRERERERDGGQADRQDRKGGQIRQVGLDQIFIFLYIYIYIYIYSVFISAQGARLDIDVCANVCT